jgi:hypothetical protein
MTVEHNESPKVVIQIRGRIHKGSPTFDACNQARERKTFQRMLELSDEAVITRTRLNQMLHDHPLSSKLKGMSTSEAVSYLLIMTEQMVRPDLNRVSDKGGLVLSDMRSLGDKLPESKPTNIPKPAPDIAAGTSVGPTALELDDDMFDAFSSFSSNMQ